MPTVTLKNVSDGPRGVHNARGELVLIEAGRTAGVELTEAEFKDLSKEWFEVGDAAEPGPLDQSIADFTAHLDTVEDPAEIDRLVEDETAGKARKGALAALEARKAALAG